MKTTKLAWECGARAAPEGNTLWCWQSDALGTGSLFSSQGAICLVTLFYTPLQVTARTRRPLRLPAGPAAPCPLQVNPCSRSALCEPRAASLRSPRQPAALACGAQKLWDAVAGWRGERCRAEATRSATHCSRPGDATANAPLPAAPGGTSWSWGCTCPTAPALSPTAGEGQAAGRSAHSLH